MEISEASPTVRRVAISVRGIVQGVGFRPFVYNAARVEGLSGWVRNESGTVRIEVQGEPTAVDAFLARLRNTPPPQARLDAVEIEDIPPLEATATPAFEIRASAGGSPPRPTIPADLATCPDCLAEIADPAERRHNYPFTNCTNCGPRWSIIERLPYDRPNTSMAAFAMCPECRAEYENPADRRFHAQPIACPLLRPPAAIARPRRPRVGRRRSGPLRRRRGDSGRANRRHEGPGRFSTPGRCHPCRGRHPAPAAEAPPRPSVRRDARFAGRDAMLLPGFGGGGPAIDLASGPDRALAATGR